MADLTSSEDIRNIFITGLENAHALEKQAIQKAIAQHQGNLSKAAQALGLGRTTLYRKMTRYGLQ